MLPYRRIHRKLVNLMLPALQWMQFLLLRMFRKGRALPGRELPLVVSLTSFPARIGVVDRTIRSILLQSVRPDKVVLWLAPDQFPRREKDLPERLLKLRVYGLSIEWYRDIRSYKKLIPTLKIYPESVIVTADDDMLYRRKWLEILYRAYLTQPGYVHCHRITKFFLEGDEFRAIPGGFDHYPEPSYLNKLTGCGGVLYPPHALYVDVTDEEHIRALAPTNDDIWFWLMAVLNDVRINVPKRHMAELYYVGSSQKGPKLSTGNDGAAGLFWIQFKQVLDAYPSLGQRLREESARMARRTNVRRNEGYAQDRTDQDREHHIDAGIL